VQAARAVRRVSKFGEENQELCLRPPGGGGGDIRLSPPCGNSLEDCVCGVSPPKPVRNGSLEEAIVVAREASAAAAAAAAKVAGGGAEEGDRANDHRDDGSNRAGPATASAREAKRRRVLTGLGVSGDGDCSGASRGWTSAPPETVAVENAELDRQGRGAGLAGDACVGGGTDGDSDGGSAVRGIWTVQSVFFFCAVVVGRFHMCFT